MSNQPTMYYEYAEKEQEVTVQMPEGATLMLFTKKYEKLVVMLCSVIGQALKTRDAVKQMASLAARVMRGRNNVQ